MILDPTLSEWLNLLFRWIHVFAGIMWVGTTYYFTWLDARLTEEEKAALNTGVTPQVWMVHSGGFYVVERRKIPDLASRTLHWFRWEAGITWLSGFALLVLIYYLGGGALIDPDVYDISLLAAVGLGIGVIFACGFVYDVLMQTPLEPKRKSICRGRVCGYSRCGLWTNTGFQCARGLHSCRSNFRNYHGGERLDAHPARAKEND